MAFGLDFGTTNSALAFVDSGSGTRLAEFVGPDGPTPTFRSLLYFDREDSESPIERYAGPAALVAYLERDVHGGRLIQSMKSFLASRLFSATENLRAKPSAGTADREPARLPARGG